MKNIKANGFFVPIVISFAIICLIMLLGVSVSYLRSTSVVKSNIENYNTSIVMQIKSVIDSGIDNAVQKLYDYCYDKRINEYAGMDNFYDPETIMTSLDIINMSSTVCLTNKYLTDIFVYSDRTGIVVNRTTYYKAEDFYREKMGSFGLSEEEWDSVLHSYSNFKFFISRGPNENILVLKAITRGVNENVVAVVGVMIDGAELSSILKVQGTVNGMNTYILDDSGGVVAYSGAPPQEKISLPASGKASGPGLFYEKIDGVPSLVTYVASAYNGLHYAGVVPSSIIMTDLNYIRTMTLIIIILFILAVAFLSVYINKKAYGPVKNFIARIKVSVSNSDADNDFSGIVENLERSLKEKEDIKKNINDLFPIIKNNILLSLVSEERDEGNLRDLETYNIRFKYNAFVLLIIEIEDANQFITGTDHEEKALLKFTINNIGQDIFSVLGDICPVEYSNDKIVFILNFDKNQKNAEELIQNCAEEILKVLKNLFSLTITIGISNSGTRLSCLSDLCREAEEALAYKFLNGINTVNRFQNIEFNASEYFYPVYMEYKLINSVTVGNEKQALDILEEIFVNNFKKNSHPIKYSRCLFFDIISTVLKMSNELKIDLDNVFHTGFNIEKELIDCQTVDEMYTVIRQIIVEICRFVNNRTKSKNDELLNSIMEHIGRNYTNEQICIASIADAVTITQNYLSHYFKEKAGIPVMKYIESLRIARAKELLLESDKTLDAITREIGFSNSAVFIRAFKKKEGITPGQFRERSPGDPASP